MPDQATGTLSEASTADPRFPAPLGTGSKRLTIRVPVADPSRGLCAQDGFPQPGRWGLETHLMTNDELRPYPATGNTAQGGLAPHLMDYWYVVSRHLWLVVTALVLTLALSFYALTRKVTYYQADVTLQITDPMEQSRSLTSGSRLSNSDIFVDPIQSEIELLSSAALARTVVDQAGLRLLPTDGLMRSDLWKEGWIAPSVPPGTRYQLVHAEDGSLELMAADGSTLARSPEGGAVEASGIRIELAAGAPVGRHGLRVPSYDEVVGEIQPNIWAEPREGTNLIDVRFATLDSALAASVTNVWATALRDQGAERVREQASRDVEFIQEQLDSARAQLTRSLNAIRSFKESEAFTSLSFEEQELVNEGHRLADEVERYQWHLSVFRALIGGMEQSGAEGVDLVRFLAELPADANPEIRMGATRIQEKTNELDRVVTLDLKTRAHPAAQALINQIGLLEVELVAAVRASIGVTEQRLLQASADLADVRARQRAFPALANELQTLELERELDQDAYQYLLSQLYQARIMEAAAGPYVHIVDPAETSYRAPSGGRGYMILGTALGLFLGICASFFVEYLDRTVRTRAEAEGLLGHPVLGTVPELRGSDPPSVPAKGPRLVVRDPFERAGEAFRGLRLNLSFLNIEGRPVKSILVTSPGPVEGKSTTSLNLAATFAQYGERVLLIDADLRRPVLHGALDIARDPGLTHLLIGSATPEDVIHRDVIPNLDVIPAGPIPPNPAEMVGSMVMSETLGRLEGEYDRVIVDSPPVLAVTDAAGTASFVDGVLLVLRSGHTEQRAAERTAEHLGRLGVRILGLVLNDIQRRVHEESYYLRYHARYEADSVVHESPRTATADQLRGALAKVRLR